MISFYFVDRIKQNIAYKNKTDTRFTYWVYSLGNCMKEYLNIFSRSVTLCFVLLILQACGGSSKSNDEQNSFRISADTTAISFSNEILQISDDTYQVKVNFVGDGLLVGFAPGAEVASWLNYTTSNVTNSSATIEIKVASAELLPPNNYQTKLRLSAGDISNRNLVHHDIDVSLLVWDLRADTELISYDVTLGQQTVEPQSFNIASLGENSWELSSDVPWISFDNNEGQGESTVTVTADITSFNSAGRYAGNIVLTEATTGDSKSIPVEVGVDNLYFYADSTAVLLTQTPNVQAPHKNLTIQSNALNEVNWQASTEAPWLVLNKSTNQVNISLGDVSELENGTHSATVLVAQEGDVQQVLPLSVQVNFYKSDQVAENKLIEEVQITSIDYVTSPKLPRFYLSKDHSLQTYHSYTGELISEFTVAPEGSRLEQLIIHPDGDILLAKAIETIVNDDESTTTQVHFYKIDLLTSAVEELAPDLQFDPVKFISVSGRHYVVSQVLELADTNLKRKFWHPESAFFTTVIEQATQAQSLFALDLSDSSISRFELSANDFTTATVSLTETHSYLLESLEEGQVVANIAISPQESDIYLISPNSEWVSFDGTNFTDNGLLEQTDGAVTLDLTIAQNGYPHFVRFENSSGFYIDIYNQNNKVNTVLTQGQQPNTVQLSADDKRMVIHSAATQRIELISVEQINVSTQTINVNSRVGEQVNNLQDVTITGISDTAQVTTTKDWLTVSTSNNQDTLIIAPVVDTSKLSGWGRFTATITIYDPESGSSSSILVTIDIDETRLFSNGSQALGFYDLDGEQNLSQTVTIKTNAASMPQWQATSSVSWLSVDVDQDTNTLTVATDPSGLGDGTYFAEITLASVESGHAISSTIPVSFYKNDEIVEEVNVTDIAINNNGSAVDPFRPYIYFAQDDKIKVVNVFNGEIVSTIDSLLPSIQLTDLVIHPNGSSLLVSNEEEYQDENDQTQTRINHYQVDLTDYSMTQLDSDLITIDTRYRPADIIMVDGKAIVVTQVSEFADLSLSSLFWDQQNAFLTNTYENNVSTNQVLSFNSANNTLRNTQLSYNEFADNKLSVESVIDYQNSQFGGSIQSIATSRDGANMYTASLASEWSTFDGQQYNDQGVLHNTVVVASILTETNAQDELFIYRFVFGIGFVLSKYDATQQNQWDVIHTTGSTDIFLATPFNRLMSLNNGTLNLDSYPD